LTTILTALSGNANILCQISNMSFKKLFVLFPGKMVTLKNFKTNFSNKLAVRKARWVGHFGPSQKNEQVEQTQPQGKSMKIHTQYLSVLFKKLIVKQSIRTNLWRFT